MMGVHVFINSTVMSNDSIHSILTWEKANEKVKPNVVYPSGRRVLGAEAITARY